MGFFFWFFDLFTIFELFLDRISSKRTCEQCTLTVHSEYTYIEERIASKQAKQERLVPLSCGDRATLWCCFSFARISWKRTSEFLSRVEAYLCYSLRNTLHVCYFHQVKITFCDIKKNYENIWFWKCETIFDTKFFFLDFWRSKYQRDVSAHLKWLCLETKNRQINDIISTYLNAF